MPIIVKKKPGESDDKLINRFRLQVRDEDIVGRARENREHIGGAEKRKNRKAEIKRRQRQEKMRNKRYS